MIGSHQLQIDWLADSAEISDGGPDVSSAQCSDALTSDAQAGVLPDEVVLLPHLRRIHKLLIERLDFARVDISELERAVFTHRV